MQDQVDQLYKQFEDSLKKLKTSRELDDLRIRFLGKKGSVTSLMQNLRDCTPEERPHMGKVINELKVRIEARIDSSMEKVKLSEINDRLESETIDVSLPGRRSNLGRAHPISREIERTASILSQMGFSQYCTSELDSDYYNYGGLNYPEDHPARDMQDTYYVDEHTLLRSHTTNFQQKVMESHAPPIRVANIGRCYRNETISARSHVIFHQNDVLYIDKGVTFADLLATIEEFYSKLLGESVQIRVRASYFPFVEPGCEVDVKCLICKGNGCRLCKHSGWLEVAGAGMVHPEVLKAGGIDPEEYSGFAWGGGIERVYMLLHGIRDIRLFTENDERFLEQFP